jgi:hypothetical protein
MILAAAALTLGISLEIDLTGLIKMNRRSGSQPNVTCGIKVVGYHFTGDQGQKFTYAGQTFTIPSDGFIEVISLPRVNTYVAEGRTLRLADGRGGLDGFSFQWISLKGETE